MKICNEGQGLITTLKELEEYVRNIKVSNKKWKLKRNQKWIILIPKKEQKK